MKTARWLTLLAAVACGEAAETGRTVPNGAPPTPSAAGTASGPSWMTLDDGGRSATLSIVAGEGSHNDGWNFNGHSHGDVTVVVPLGIDVSIRFSNEDPANRHSLAILQSAGRFPIAFDAVTPAFAGAITSGATSSTESTPRGGSETIAFAADRVGDYALVCLVPAHAASGMWIGFAVEDAGELALRR